MPLCEALSGLVAHQLAVEILERSVSEGALQEDLARSGAQQVFASDDFSYPHLLVINDNRELICGHVITTPHDKISEITARDELLWTKPPINERDRLVIGHAEPPIQPCG